LVIVLQLVNLVAVPLWAGQVVSGASISSAAILKNLLELVLIPLVIGLIVRGRYAENAAMWQPELVKVANLGGIPLSGRPRG
jgi:BASS family bile acid:Na+ symporter